MGRVTDLIIVGDEAWTPEEWEAEQRRSHRTPTPASRARGRERARRWRERHPELHRQRSRECMRRLRLERAA